MLKAKKEEEEKNIPKEGQSKEGYSPASCAGGWAHPECAVLNLKSRTPRKDHEWHEFRKM